MEGFAVLVTQLKWLVNVTQGDVSLTTATDIYSISFDSVFQWLLYFIKMPFVLPMVVVQLYCVFSLSAYVYQYYYGLSNTSTDDKQWDMFKYLASKCFHCYGRLYHGYEIEGIENVPEEGAALMVMYHGAVPSDMCFIVANLYLSANRQVRLVMDQTFFKIPGFGKGLKVLDALPGPIEACSSVLKDGHLMIIAPGGSYEGMFSGSNYQLLWRNRLGYAKAAIEAKSPIIPVFTVNISDAYRTISIGRSLFEKLYLKVRFPLVPIYGGLPVKLKTIIGEPIEFDPALTAEELNSKVLMSMEQLIKDNQRLPGSIPMALMDRFKCQKVKVL